MLYQNLEKLCTLAGVSGCEDAVREELLRMVEGQGMCRVDPLGNLLGFKKGKRAPAKKLLLSAHMDEVGLIITHIGEDGLLKFATVGGIDKRVIPGRAVRIGAQQVFGVVGVKPVHLKPAEEREKAHELDALYIDIGATTREQAQEQVTLGDRAVFVSHYCTFGDGFLRGRALDDRAGCALLVELLQSELEYDTHFAFTVQEETGTTGAKTAANQIAAEIGIVVETTTACDIPDLPPEKVVCSLGKGPVISFMDRGTIYDAKLYAQALEIAKLQQISCQSKAGVYGGNEARSIQTAGSGTRMLAVSIPCRYLHTPSCVAKKTDIEESLRLLKALIGAFGE